MNHDEAFVPETSFKLLKLRARGTVLYLQDFAGATYPEDVNVIQQYAGGFQRLLAASEEPEESRQLIAKVAAQYR